MTINIVESNQGFAPCTVISPVAILGHEPTVMNIGHIDEIHYLSTIPYNQQMVEINVSCSSQFAQATGNETVVNTLSKQDERARKREWIRKKRASKEYRDKEKKARDNEKIRESQRETFKKQKVLNPTHVRDLNKKAFFKRKQNNREHVRELKRQAFIRKKEENPNHIKKINNDVQKRKRDQSRQLQRDELELLETSRKKQSCAVAAESQEIKMEKVIQSFHDSIKCGPKYICSCCDQLWYRSSVTKCDNEYTKCTKKSITGKTSVDNNEWICLTCHSNLSNGKLPVCSKANKMRPVSYTHLTLPTIYSV